MGTKLVLLNLPLTFQGRWCIIFGSNYTGSKLLQTLKLGNVKQVDINEVVKLICLQLGLPIGIETLPIGISCRYLFYLIFTGIAQLILEILRKTQRS